MNIYGLIGANLAHSFSPNYFKNKFEEMNIQAIYQSFELLSPEDLPAFLQWAKKSVSGLNVTIPYKELVIPYLDGLNEAAQEIAAVNCIKINHKQELIGYNTDYLGFLKPLYPFLNLDQIQNALVLGTGGASKAVVYALRNKGIKTQVIGRKEQKQYKIMSYESLRAKGIADFNLIVNTTPLGMNEWLQDAPDIQYNELHEAQIVYDLIYNPTTTVFLEKAFQQGAQIINGYEMLIEQAECSWEIWKS